MEKLAIFGGKSVRKEDIYYGRQYIDEADIRAVENTLRGRLITCGPRVDALEARLCEVTGAKYAVATSNGTAALHVACLALGIGPGDEVITTPMTFVASANCARYCGATVVFADINPSTYNVDPDEIEKKITPKTKAIVAVDFTGQAVELDRIQALCRRHNIYLIEDAAHSIGTRYNGRPVGSIADITCFSFHPVKTVTSGEGGAVTTNDARLYRKLVVYHSHGITHDEDWMEQKGIGHWYYEQQDLGFNYRMTDFQAALLNSQLDKLEMFSKRRKEIVAQYNAAFADVPELILQQEIPESDTTRHLYIIQLRLDRLRCTRREFFDAMSAERVCCQVHYIPVYYFPYYRKLGYEKGLCPNAEKLYEGIMSIPLFYSLTDDDVQDVIHTVKKVIEYYRIEKQQGGQ